MTEMQMDLFGGETEYVGKRRTPAPAAPAKAADVQLELFKVTTAKPEVGIRSIFYIEPELFDGAAEIAA